LAEALIVEPLQRHIEQSQGASAYLIHHCPIGRDVQGGVQAGGSDAAAGKGVDLILHQGDQGRDDQGQAR